MEGLVEVRRSAGRSHSPLGESAVQAPGFNGLATFDQNAELQIQNYWGTPMDGIDALDYWQGQGQLDAGPSSPASLLHSHRPRMFTLDTNGFYIPSESNGFLDADADVWFLDNGSWAVADAGGQFSGAPDCPSPDYPSPDYFSEGYATSNPDVAPTPTPVSTPGLSTEAPTPQSQHSGSHLLLTPPNGKVALSRMKPRQPKRGHAIGKARKVSCDICTWEGPSHLARHVLEKHNKPGADGDLVSGWYLCRCGYKSPRASDFFHRHFKTCKKPLVHADYACQCTTLFGDRSRFVDHAGTCGKKQLGRPPKSSSSSLMSKK